jgi:hypothetical protein
MMPRDKPQTDNLSLLSRRQALVGDKVLHAINTLDGMSATEWAIFLNIDINDTIIVPLSPRLRQALKMLTRSGGYSVSDNLYEVYWMLFDDFARSRDAYVARGWVTVEPDAQLVQSTMTDPIAAEKIMGPLLEDEDDE